MDHPLRRPDEILVYRSLSRILGARPRTVWAVGPADSTLTALQVMADKKTTFLVVLDQGQMVGVVARRGFWQDHRAFGIFQGDRNRSHDHSIDC